VVGARLVIPVGPHDRQELIVVERHSPTDWQEWSDGSVVFVPLVGEGGWPEAGHQGNRPEDDRP
jgi:protein-L-isoaspartate(D-aspartate) O-methyltransferase